MFIRVDVIHERVRQTDGQTDGHCISGGAGVISARGQDNTLAPLPPPLTPFPPLPLEVGPLPVFPPLPPFPPLPLEVGPLNPARGSGGAL